MTQVRSIRAGPGTPAREEGKREKDVTGKKMLCF